MKMDNRMPAFVKDEFKTMEDQLESKILPQEILEKMLNELMANKFVEHNFRTHEEETSILGKHHLPSWFFKS
jgi:hypothetical protein